MKETSNKYDDLLLQTNNLRRMMRELMVFGDKIGFDYDKEMIESMLVPG